MKKFIKVLRKPSRIIAVVLIAATIISCVFIMSNAQDGNENSFDYIKTIATKQSYSVLEVVPDDENLFNFQDWYNSGSSVFSSSTGTETISYDVDNESMTIKKTSAGGDNYTAHDLDSRYKIAVEPGAKYVLSYRLTGTTNAVSRIFFFQYKTSDGGYSEWSRSGQNETTGSFYPYCDNANSTYTHVINTLSDTNYLQFRFGVRTDIANQELTISDIKLVKIEDYEFDFNAWKYNSISPYVEHPDDGKNYATVGDDYVTVTTTSTDYETNLTTDGGKTAYNMPVLPDTTYILRYYCESALDTACKSNLMLYFSDSSYNHLSTWSKTETQEGYHTYTFTTPSNAYYLQTRFGTATTNSSVTFSDISIKKCDSYNLFDFDAWCTNTNSFRVSCNSGSKLSANRDTQTVTISSVYSGKTEEYTAYSGNKNYYNMVVEPNTKYYISFDLSVTSSDSSKTTARGQFFAFTYNENMGAAAMSGTTNPHVGMRPTVTVGETVTQYGSFTTGANAKYLQIRLGTTDTNSSSATYSNIRIYKADDIVGESDNNSSLGFYAGGSEPFANMSEALAGLNRSEREAYTEKLKTKLENFGLISTGNSTVLQYSSNKTYTEKYPWEDTTGGVEVILNHPEATTAKGSYEKYTSGEYTDDYCYNADYVYNYISASGENGAYNADIQYYVELSEADYKAQSNINKYTYYIEFKFIEADAFGSIEEGTPIYKKTSSDSVHTYLCNYGDEDLIMDEDEVYGNVDSDGNADYGYYYASVVSAGVWDYWSVHHYCVAVYDGYVKAGDSEKGYFRQVESDYYYVGEGLGLYKFVAGGSTTVDVEYGKIYYMPFYENNEWFKQYVFDLTETKAKATDSVKVNVKTVSVTELNDNPDIMYSYDMIAFTSASYCGEDNYFNLDMRADTVTALENYIKNNNIPVIVDNDVYTKAEKTVELKKLVEWLYKEDTSTVTGSNSYSLDKSVGGVNNNIYIFNKKYLTGVSSLVTNSFYTALDSEYYCNERVSGTINESTSYREVYDTINAENTKRDVKGITKMDVHISMGTAIRNIINHTSSTITNKKTEIKVLEIEPYSSKKSLSEDTVRSWFDLDSSVTVNITTMAVAEYIGKIEDIVENYDAVYIGSSTENMFTLNGKPNYNDSNMDGMYYTNIGDLYYSICGIYEDTSRATAKLGGIYWEDYFYREGVLWIGGSRSVKYSDWYDDNYAFYPTTVRSSGNDITPKKLAELTEAADANIPIILSDDLMMKSQSFKYVVKLEKDSSYSQNPKTVGDGYEAYLKATLCVYSENSDGTPVYTPVTEDSLPEGIGYQFSWYKDGTLLSGQESTKTVTENGGYYVVANFYNTSSSLTYRYNEIKNVTVQSNTVNVNQTKKSYNFSIWRSDVTNNRYYYTIQFNNGVYPSSVVYYGNAQYNWIGSEWDFDSTAGTSSAWAPLNGSYCYGAYLHRNNAVDRYSYGDCKLYLTKIIIDGHTYTTSDNGSQMTAWRKSGTDNTFTCSYLVATIDDSSKPTDIKTISVKSEINPESVDNSSYWYEALSTLTTTKLNVLSASEAVENSEDLNRYLNLSQPKITGVTGYDEYDESNPVSIEDDTLTCEFEIENETDLTPNTTTYKAELWIDVDADGIYETEEKVSDIDIYEMSEHGNTLVSSDELHQNSSTATHRYLMERRLTSEFSGCIPWKLTITKVGDSTAHSSITHYAYNQPDSRPTLKLIQIIKGSDAVSSTVFASDIFKEKTSTGEAGLNIFVSGTDNGSSYTVKLKTKDYDIVINVFNMATINTLSVDSNFDNLVNIIESYDMLIVGFGDSYNNDVTANSARCIETAIESGMPVLYTHDATSYYNDFANDTSDLEHEGYFMNIFVRSDVGLDRYGVAYVRKYRKEHLVTDMGYDDLATVDGWNGRTSSNYVGYAMYEEYEGFTGFTAESLSELGYTIPYKPGSGRTEILKDFAHGYTRHTMTRFNMPIMTDGDNDYRIIGSEASVVEPFTNCMYGVALTPTKCGVYKITKIVEYEKLFDSDTYGIDSDDDYFNDVVQYYEDNDLSPYGSNVTGSDFDFFNGKESPIYGTGTNSITTTNTVTIVNRGQLTQYPYKLNDTITVNTTHEQYYQLNVSDPEVITWFCLAGDNYSDIKNDCANCYYIYTKDNVTYTGAGHTNTFSLDEAKLFINTLMVAYNAGDEIKPAVTFRNENDNKTQSYCTLASTSVDIGSDNKDSAYGNIYYKVSNLNTQSSLELGTINVELFCKVNETEQTICTINNVSANTLNRVYIDYSSAVGYGTTGGNTLASWLIDEKDSEFTVYARTTTNIGEASEQTSDETTIKLRKVVYKGLS